LKQGSCGSKSRKELYHSIVLQNKHARYN